MKHIKSYFAIFLLFQIGIIKAQDVKPHFAAIHFAPVFESIKTLKTGYGTSLEGAYFLNNWFGAGGIFRYSMHPYEYTDFKSSGNAGQIGFSANVFVHKLFFNEKISLVPSMGIGFTSTTLPSGTFTQKELQETAPGIYTTVETQIPTNAINVTSFMFNVFSVDINYQFKPNMSAGVKLDYQLSVSNTWPNETMGDFFSIGIGYSYFFGVK
jgi:hypothetical protein